MPSSPQVLVPLVSWINSSVYSSLSWGDSIFFISSLALVCCYQISFDQPPIPYGTNVSSSELQNSSLPYYDLVNFDGILHGEDCPDQCGFAIRQMQFVGANMTSFGYLSFNMVTFSSDQNCLGANLYIQINGTFINTNTFEGLDSLTLVNSTEFIYNRTNFYIEGIEKSALGGPCYVAITNVTFIITPEVIADINCSRMISPESFFFIFSCIIVLFGSK